MDSNIVSTARHACVRFSPVSIVTFWMNTVFIHRATVFHFEDALVWIFHYTSMLFVYPAFTILLSVLSFVVFPTNPIFVQKLHILYFLKSIYIDVKVVITKGARLLYSMFTFRVIQNLNISMNLR